MTSNGKQDQRKIVGMEDSSMTIEFLRARLLAERSVSQTARQRADELAERVLLLEEQLKIVSLQRKKAEKATAAVLSILENEGISDASEDFDSGFDPEEIFSDSKGAESTDNRNKQNPTPSNVKERENDADISSSEIVSSPSTGRSLSWKSGKLSLQKSFDRKEYTDSAWRRTGSFTSNGTSSAKRVGKSCRRIRRSNTKSATDELQNTSSECPPVRLPSSSNNGHQSLMDSTGNSDVKDQHQCPASHVSEDQRKKGESDEDMERALQHKAQLIGQYEAEEKAQREWEEKYRENNSYAQDSCDPGNYSDVTEERNDMKAFEEPYSTEMINLQNHANKFQDADIPSANGVTDVPSTPHADTGFRKDQNCSRTVNYVSPASEFALSRSNGSCPENHGVTPAYSCHQFPSANGSPIHPLEYTITSSGGSSSLVGRAVEGAYEQALVSPDASDNIGAILGALEQAKFSLSQKINVLPVAKGGSSVEHSVPVTRIEDRLDIPPRFPGLFRLPTDFQLEATTTTSNQGLPSRFGSANHSHETGYDQFFTTTYMDSGSNAITGNRFSSISTRPFPEVDSELSSKRPIFGNTLGTGLPHSTGFDYLNPPSSFDLPFSSKSTNPTYPFRPNTETTTSKSQASCSPLYESSRAPFCPIVVPNLFPGEEAFLRSFPRNKSDQEDEAHHNIDSESNSSDESLKYKNRGIDESQSKNERLS
ncbi:unnamed protein product [Withania somnifera]